MKWLTPRLLIVAAAIIAAGCGRGMGPALGAPVPDPAGTEEALRAATTPTGPLQSAFSWVLIEQGSRLIGRGVARQAAPERLRLDLFGPRGETYLAAALVGEEFRLPAQVAEAFTLPSPALLWSAVGIIRPPAHAELSGVTSTGGLTEMRYLATDGRLYAYRVRTDGGPPRLLRLERTTGRGVEESVELTWDAEGVLRQARYRDWSAFRDLTLTYESITDVPEFPDAIWRP
jgi:hypothetical protein